jgi:predicted AAA+ superfamily ATPase
MSDKYSGIYVTFEKEITKEYLEIVKNLITSIKGVISVQEKVSDIDHWMAREQIKHEFRMKLFETFK